MVVLTIGQTLTSSKAVCYPSCTGSSSIARIMVKIMDTTGLGLGYGYGDHWGYSFELC